jgi:hypothetical protein
MLSRDDMLNLVCKERRIVLAEMAVFASISRPLSHGNAARRIHPARPADLIALRALAWRIAITSNASTCAEYSVSSRRVSLPAEFFAASSPTRCVARELARSPAIRAATAGVRQSPKGSSSFARIRFSPVVAIAFICISRLAGQQQATAFGLTV